MKKLGFIALDCTVSTDALIAAFKAAAEIGSVHMTVDSAGLLKLMPFIMTLLIWLP
jgi:hypothetical protein